METFETILTFYMTMASGGVILGVILYFLFAWRK